MTFLEKAMEINRIKGKIRTRTQILEMMCPYEYKLEEEKECNKTKPVECQKCWNREMPNTELVKTVTLPMPPNTEPHFSNPVIEKAYNTGKVDGRNQVWELVRKFYDMKCDELEKIFDVSGGFYEVIRNFSPHEAIAKLKAYEEAQIEIGDVVEDKIDTLKAVVMDNGSQEFLWQVFTENGCIELWKECEFKKTGKHIDIQSILEQIK